MTRILVQSHKCLCCPWINLLMPMTVEQVSCMLQIVRANEVRAHIIIDVHEPWHEQAQITLHARASSAVGTSRCSDLVPNASIRHHPAQCLTCARAFPCTALCLQPAPPAPDSTSSPRTTFCKHHS